MSKDDELPEIPSWEELGISPDEVAELEAEIAGEGGADGSQKPAPASRPKPPPKEGASKPKRRLFAWGRPPKRAPTDAPKAGAGASGGAPPPEPPRPKAGPADTPPRGKEPPPADRERSAPRLRGPLTLAALLVVAWFSSSSRDIPRPVAVDAPDSVFSAERAWLHLEQIARAPHPTGSAEHTRVREYLLGVLRDLGLDPTVQTTTSMVGRGSQVRAATVRNIVARIPGTGSPGAVLATAHYDGRQVSKGAGDDGTGVVALLEAVRALRTGPPLAHDVIILLTDAEELGLLGARAFVDQHPWMADVRLALSLEMRGAGGPALMFETGPENGWVVEQFAQVGPHPHTNSLSYEVYKRLPNDTDFTPFKDAGIQGLNFAAIGRAHVYHQAYDDLDHLSKATVQHHGVQALTLLRHLGNADLSVVTGPDRVFVSLPFLGTVTYPPWVSYALSGVVALLLLILFGAVRRAGLGVGGVLGGLVVSLLVVAGAAAAGWGLLEWLPRFHLETGRLHGSLFRSEGWYVLALVPFTVFLAGLARWFFAKRVSLAELVVGGTVIPALLAIVAGVLVPMGAMNLQWPVLAALVAAFVSLGVRTSSGAGWLRWGAWVLLAVPVLVFMVPLTELVWLAMSFRLAVVLGVMVGMGALLLWPVLEVAREPNGWVTGTVGLLASVACVGVGLVLARPSAARPLPSTLVYAMDRVEGSAFWATDPARAEASPARLDLVWAAQQAGAVDSLRVLGHLIPGSGSYAVSAAPAAAVAMPRVVFDADSVAPGSARGVRVQVSSPGGAEQLSFVFPPNGPRPHRLNGRPLVDAQDVQGLEHWGVPEGAVVLDYTLAADVGTLSFHLLEVYFQPERIAGVGTFDRPPELSPDLTRASDRAIIRTPIEIDVLTGATSVAGTQAPAGVVAGGGTAADSALMSEGTMGPPVSVQLFARDLISTVPPEFSVSFSPDGRTVYFNRTDDARANITMLASLLRNGDWSEPEAVPWSSGARDVDPFVSPDGDRIWFSSNRPRGGQAQPEYASWYVERTATGWSDPIDPGPPLNSDSADVFISQARDGTVVFSSTRDGAQRIYLSRPAGSGWEPPVALRFGTVDTASNPFISPDGSFILLAIPTPAGPRDLFVSCRAADGSWGRPSRLPNGINSPFDEFTPTLHPVDGGLLFTSERPGILGPVPEGVRPPGDLYRADPTWRVACGSEVEG